MDSTRRNFLKVAGVATVGLTAGAAKADASLLDSAKELLFGPKGAAPFENALKGSRWAMVINTRKLNEKVRHQMIEACHSIHNVPVFDKRSKSDKFIKDEIKWIWPEEFENAFVGQENEHLPPEVTRNEVLILCNHCQNPPCVRVCPTKATFQRPDGIVIMDYHRCIGCRFCMAACPYGSRSFNFKDPKKGLGEINPEFPTRMKGVVEKCNFCAERLARGQMPACVEVCKNGEVVFGDLNDPESKVSQVLRQHYTIRRRPEIGTQPQVYYIV